MVGGPLCPKEHLNGQPWLLDVGRKHESACSHHSGSHTITVVFTSAVACGLPGRYRWWVRTVTVLVLQLWCMSAWAVLACPWAFLARFRLLHMTGTSAIHWFIWLHGVCVANHSDSILTLDTGRQPQPLHNNGTMDDSCRNISNTLYTVYACASHSRHQWQHGGFVCAVVILGSLPCKPSGTCVNVNVNVNNLQAISI